MSYLKKQHSCDPLVVFVVAIYGVLPGGFHAWIRSVSLRQIRGVFDSFFVFHLFGFHEGSKSSIQYHFGAKISSLKNKVALILVRFPRCIR